MEFTGERVIPGQVNADLWAEHMARYRFALTHAQGAKVLDAGCGAGYGTAVLAETATSAIGFDFSHEAARRAASTYRRPNLSYVTASATAMPFSDSSFDLLTAFELIEHIPDWRELIREARRVLKPAGVFIVSTPNRDYYNESRGESGPNPYHVHEFTYDEFKRELDSVFPNTRIFVQNYVNAFAIHPDDRATAPTTDFAGSPGDPHNAHFFIALCSQTELSSLEGYVYIPESGNVLREREHHVKSLQAELSSERADRVRHVQSLESQLAEERIDRERHIQSLDAELIEERTQRAKHVASLNSEIADARCERDTMIRAHAELTASLNESNAWAKRLDQELRTLRESRWVRLGKKLGMRLEPSEHDAKDK